MLRNAMETKAFEAFRPLKGTFWGHFWASGPGSEAWDLGQNRGRMFFFRSLPASSGRMFLFRSLGRLAVAACFFSQQAAWAMAPKGIPKWSQK